MPTDLTEGQQRADARRNRQRVLDAAADVLSRSGQRVSMEEIARRAGVGVGTVCRNFPTKQELIDAVLTALYEALLTDILDALAMPDANAGFERFMVILSDFQARHRALAEQMAKDIELQATTVDARKRLRSAISELLKRAQAAGSVRADIGPADVAVMLSGIAHATAIVGDLRSLLTDRYLRIILDGLRPAGASPLPGEPLDFEGLDGLKRRGRA
jgi:AcrR family transcriptional regulator